MRYYYDGLLEKRFPNRYRNDVDVHEFWGMRISHLRRKIYSVFTISQILTILFMSMSVMPAFLLHGVLSLHLLAYAAVVFVHLKHVKPSSVRLRDFLPLLFVVYLVPWVLIIQRWRGCMAFRNEPQFSSSKWLTMLENQKGKRTSSAKVIPIKPGVHHGADAKGSVNFG